MTAAGRADDHSRPAEGKAARSTGGRGRGLTRGST